MFKDDELVILNADAKSGLPNRVGERCRVITRLYNSDLYDYHIEFDDHSKAKVKESELTKASEADQHYMSYIFTGNELLYTTSYETVKVTKVDYVNRMAGIRFEDGAELVVEFNKLGEKIFDEDDDILPVIENVSLKESPREQSHKNVIEEIHNTFKIKNADYGNSFGEQYAEYGLLSAVIRLDDKMRRLKQLMKQDAQVKDESIRDTVLDLANYAIMTVMELDNKN